MLLTLDDRLLLRELFGDGSQLEHLKLLVFSRDTSIDFHLLWADLGKEAAELSRG
jgi:hypothetical protein